MNLYNRWLAHASGERKSLPETHTEAVVFIVANLLKEKGGGMWLLKRVFGETEDEISRAMDTLEEQMGVAIDEFHR